MTVPVESSEALDAPARVVPEQQVDFQRPLVSVLGLPFDAIDLATAVRQVREAAFTGRRCFVSTPNLNFAIAARSDAAFRGSIFRSDLCLADGMPLIWIARLLRLPLRERVSGADLYAALQAHAGPPVSIFLFGGPPGAAEEAAARINRKAGGLRCVGFDTGGFGDIESMSDAQRIARINDSGAQFVIVSLGAKKGQAWIERNLPRLTAPVVSHLGAVMNFAAGTVRRAPRWMQTVGLEWLWRIREEPALWHRYAADGRAALRLLWRHVLPDALGSRRRGSEAQLPRIERERTVTAVGLKLRGDWQDADLDMLRAALTECAESGLRLTIDVTGVERLGAAGVALLLIARIWFDERAGLQIIGVSPRLRDALLHQLVADTLLGTS